MMMLSVYGFIKRMQELGFSLSEIHKLLGVVDKDDVRCSDIYEFVSQKVDEVQQQIRDLMRVENMLNDLKNVVRMKNIYILALLLRKCLRVKINF